MSEKYADILNRQWDDIPEPKELPDGTYLLKGQNVSYFPENEDQGKSARVVFFYAVEEPMDDVDEKDLQALGEDYDFGNNDIAKQFFLRRDKDWQEVRKHLETHGVSTKGRSLPDSFADFKGTEVLAVISVREYVNNQGELKRQNEAAQFSQVK